MTADVSTGELSRLLHDKYDLQIADIVVALKAMPAGRPSAAKLPQRDAALLDQAGFVEDPDAYAQVTIDNNGNWVFPVLQFESDPKTGATRQIRGVDRVLAALPLDLHPVAVAGFLRTSHPDLALDDDPRTPLQVSGR